MRILIVSNRHGYSCDKVRLTMGSFGFSKGNLENFFGTPCAPALTGSDTVECRISRMLCGNQSYWPERLTGLFCQGLRSEGLAKGYRKWETCLKLHVWTAKFSVHFAIYTVTDLCYLQSRKHFFLNLHFLLNQVNTQKALPFHLNCRVSWRLPTLLWCKCSFCGTESGR